MNFLLGIETSCDFSMRAVLKSHMTSAPNGFLLVALLGSLMVTAGCQTQVLKPAAPTDGRIPVVKTWEDLLRQPSVKLGDEKWKATPQRAPFGLSNENLNATVKLGIEAEECAVGSGIFLYCLAENITSPETITGWDDPRFGPLRVSVTFGDENESRTRMDLKDLRVLRIVDDSSKALLYFKPIIINRAGDYHISVLADSGAVIVSTVVKGVAKTTPIWEQLDSVEDFETHEIRIIYPGNASAFPDYCVSLPISVPVNNTKVGRKNPLQTLLPTFWPSVPDPTLVIKIEGQRLVINSTTNIKVSSYLGEYDFLVRWWINDKPVERSSESHAIRCGSSRQEWGKSLTFRLDGGATKIGAKKGDKIGVQLLYWDKGFMQSGGPKEVRDMDKISSLLPRLSNRVDFIWR